MKPEVRADGDNVPQLSSEEVAQFHPVVDLGDLPAWEQVDAGRFMPRRIKGSCKGRALG